MFSKQTTLHRIDSLETNDSNFTEMLRGNNDKYARTRQGYLLPNSEIDQNQKTTLKTINRLPRKIVIHMKYRCCLP